jgi:hypothetical protein
VSFKRKPLDSSGNSVSLLSPIAMIVPNGCFCLSLPALACAKLEQEALARSLLKL